jgi:hypothetical protein
MNGGKKRASTAKAAAKVTTSRKKSAKDAPPDRSTSREKSKKADSTKRGSSAKQAPREPRLGKQDSTKANSQAVAFDFVALEDRIVAASRAAFQDVAKKHPGEEICAFSLYSDGGAMTVCPAFDVVSRREKRLASSTDPGWDTFGTPEWALEGFGAAKDFNQICSTVFDHAMIVESDDATFEPFRDGLFETCLRALERLRRERVIPPDLLVVFAVSDHEFSRAQSLAHMVRLNGETSPHVVKFRKWMKHWAT